MRKKILGMFLVLGLLWFIGCNKNNPTAPQASQIPEELILEIVSFTATSQTIKRGMSTTLSWEVLNSTAIELNGETVGATGSRKVEPLESTTYILKAINAEGSISQSLAIVVENGADVVMVVGPKAKRVLMPNFPENYFCWDCWGTIKNRGIYKASFVKTYLYFLRVNGGYFCVFMRVDKLHLKPNEKSSWDMRTQCLVDDDLDLSKIEYEITWSEHTETYTTGRKLIE